MSSNNRPGKVVIAGAGPGDAELITVKLQKRLAEADIIITDRLVNPEIITAHARKETPVILTGKEGFNQASYTQQQITDLIIEHALHGKNVLRLKGGDVAFFSNVLDELEALAKHKIDFEIIPGITAASGVSAYAGIPLTARNYSQGVHFITFNPSSEFILINGKSGLKQRIRLFFTWLPKTWLTSQSFYFGMRHLQKGQLLLLNRRQQSIKKVHVSTLQNCAD
jgi:siroheme synthase